MLLYGRFFENIRDIIRYCTLLFVKSVTVPTLRTNFYLCEVTDRKQMVSHNFTTTVNYPRVTQICSLLNVKENKNIINIENGGEKYSVKM